MNWRENEPTGWHFEIAYGDIIEIIFDNIIDF